MAFLVQRAVSLFLVLFHDVCVDALLRGSADERGIRLGEMIADATVRAGVGVTKGSADRMENMAGQLGEDQVTLVSPDVSRAVAKANSLMLNIAAKDTTCDREYSTPCPDGWVLLGSRCIAPQFYNGGCARAFRPAALSIESKMQFADKCSAPWPCSGNCRDGCDYDSSTCPIGWTDAGNGICELSDQSANLPPPCASAYYFGGMDVSQRQQLTKICSIDWPCRASECAMDFSGVCPQGWLPTAGVCIAPLAYAGDCSHAINVTGMTALQLKEFATKCSVTFPCRSSNEASTVNSGVFDTDGPIVAEA